MKKILSLLMAVVMLTACTVSNSGFWYKSVDNVTECGGKAGSVEYKAISIIFEDSQNVEESVAQKISEGYDVAMGVYEEGNVKFYVEVSSKFENEEAQIILNQIVEQTNADGTYTQDIFVNKVKEYAENKWK